MNGIDILHIQITFTQMVHTLVWPEVYRFFLHIADELESFYNGRLRISLLGTHNCLNETGLRHMSIVSECSVELIVAITEIAYSHVKPCLYLIRKRVHEEGNFIFFSGKCGVKEYSIVPIHIAAAGITLVQKLQIGNRYDLEFANRYVGKLSLQYRAICLLVQPSESDHILYLTDQRQKVFDPDLIASLSLARKHVRGQIKLQRSHFD